MSIKEEIYNVIQAYIGHLHKGEYDQAYDYLYEDDVIDYQKAITEFAIKMEPFGETDDFLSRFNIGTLDALKNYTAREFLLRFLKGTDSQIDPKESKKMLKALKIVEIDEADLIANVSYTMPFKLMDEWDELESSMQLLKSDGEWKVLFKPGVKQIATIFGKEIDTYHQRKSRDPEDQTAEGELERFAIYGYRDENNKTIIEPRFSQASEFSEGLASVQIFHKYGFIDEKGEIVITPAFGDTGIFSEGLCAVQKTPSSFRDRPKWGFIDKKGNWVIEAQFESAAQFSDGYCAVAQDDKWGYINKKGEVKIPLKFDYAAGFVEGVAEVEIEVDNERNSFDIDKEGNMIEV